MDLFQTDSQEDSRQGYRLTRVELYNWGTFDRAVWTFHLDGDTSLLTGDIGSGKSTVVDALLTLLVPQQKISYNKAADSSAKERSVTSYTMGYYAKVAGADGIERPASLRGRDTYSVILASFRDAYADQVATLAEVFWFRTGEARPDHFYVVAERDLSIQADFGDFGKNIGDLKKRLKKENYVRVYDSFSDYASRFTSIFHITQEHAIDLFQQIVSMKKVNGITEFVRNNMLDDGEFGDETGKAIDELLKQFHDLQRIHQAIVRDREKLEILRPLSALSDKYIENMSHKEKYQLMLSVLPAWIASKDIHVREEDNETIRACMAESKQAIENFQRESDRIQSAMDSKQQELGASGGTRLALAQKDLEMRREVLRAAEGQKQLYGTWAERLGFSVPSTEEAFHRNGYEAGAVREKTEKDIEQCDKKRFDLDSERRDIGEKIAEAAAEIASLKARDSNIPVRFITIRSRLARDIGAKESDMPFAGEIMEVRPGEEAWEGALERLLHDFGLSLLVPEDRYEAVAGWMENHYLGQSFVYYRVEDRIWQAARDERKNAAADKILVKEDSPFAGWISHELTARFDHVCCETLAEFRKEKFALTREGQIKTQGRRHRKDDRTRIDDRRNFVLGFSNKEKIKAYEKEKARLESEKESVLANISQWKEKEKALRDRLEAARRLGEFRDFQSIDVWRAKDAVKRQQELLRELEAESDVVRRIKAEIETLRRKYAEVQIKLQSRKVEYNREESELSDSLLKIEADRKVEAAAGQKEKEEGYPLLEQYWKKPWGDKAVFTSKTADEKEKLYRRWIDGLLTKVDADLITGGQEIIKSMGDYRNYIHMRGEDDPNLRLDTDVKNIQEYKEVLRRIEKDDLPRLQPQFRSMLKEQTIQKMALFRSRLERLAGNIGQRIDEINESLRSIDYNKGRFIKIEYDETVNREIKEFRTELRKATDNSLSGTDDAYNEQKFHEIEAILVRFDANQPGHTEADAKWTKRVTDVRNWYTFAVSERIRTEDGGDGGEYEHYTDSSGKSGGQKEKLAYTILAASFVYSFGLNEKGTSFRFAMIDEAFLKSSDESAQFGLELFKQLDIQLLVVTPLAKIPAIEPYVSHVGYVSQNGRRSELRNLTIKEYQTWKDELQREGHLEAMHEKG